MEPTRQDIQTLHGVILALAEGRKGPRAAACSTASRRRGCARCWSSIRAAGCRASAARCAGWRGCSAATRPTRSACCGTRWSMIAASPASGFKRQVPIGAHIVDFVSFPLRTVIELVPADESEAVIKARADRAAWLRERGYRIIELAASRYRRRPAGGAGSDRGGDCGGGVGRDQQDKFLSVTLRCERSEPRRATALEQCASFGGPLRGHLRMTVTTSCCWYRLLNWCLFQRNP